MKQQQRNEKKTAPTLRFQTNKMTKKCKYHKMRGIRTKK